jgi:hypothetical protein
MSPGLAMNKERRVGNRLIPRLLAAVVMAALAGAACANPVHLRIAKMTQTKRQAALGEMVSAAGIKCIGIKRAIYQGSDEGGTALWSARCADGRLFAVEIANDAAGTVRIERCKSRKRGAGNCQFKGKF